MKIPRATPTNETVLLTGACSGIGLEMARILAARGYQLIVVSHRKEPLHNAAHDLQSRFGVGVFPIVMDLAGSNAAEQLFERVESLQLTVDILINNAGMFFFGEVADTNPQLANQMLALHVTTPSLLATLFSKQMRSRKRGHILFVSSISAWRDFPGIAYYGSTKKYLRGFAKALRSELAPYGVNVTCLAPGATATGLYDPNVVPVDLAKKLGVMMPAESVAQAGLEALFQNEGECMPGVLTRAMTAAAVAMPQPVIDWIRRRGPWLKGS